MILEDGCLHLPGGMMNELSTQKTICPYCGELIELVVDHSVAQQEYIEDCQVCCRPIRVEVIIYTENEVQVNVFNENE